MLAFSSPLRYGFGENEQMDRCISVLCDFDSDIDLQLVEIIGNTDLELKLGKHFEVVGSYLRASGE